MARPGKILELPILAFDDLEDLTDEIGIFDPPVFIITDGKAALFLTTDAKEAERLRTMKYTVLTVEYYCKTLARYELVRQYRAVMKSLTLQQQALETAKAEIAKAAKQADELRRKILNPLDKI